MKCPKCGSLNPETRQLCKQCGAVLRLIEEESVPNWRKEVTRKVKAYGDKKRTLTTPPGPLKDKQVAVEESALPDREIKEEFHRPLAPDAFWTVPEEPVSAETPSDEETELEIWPEDLDQDEFEEPAGQIIEKSRKEQKILLPLPEEAPAADSSYFGRRTIAWLMDTVLICAIYATLILLYAAFIKEDFQNLLKIALPAIIEIFLLFHFLYYLYFYKTSRQTPGQVFFAIELRDPASPDIPVLKILIRWLTMVALNVFNPVPLIFGSSKFLMDQVSGTEIHSLK